MKNFNPKIYKNKPRIFMPVSGATNISRLYIWNKTKECYEIPERGKQYQAKKYQLQNDRTKKRIVKFFDKVDEAKEWQQGLNEPVQIMPMEITEPVTAVSEDLGPLFKDIVSKWKIRHYRKISEGTIENYEKYHKYYLCYFYEMPIRSITAKVIDAWIDWMIANIGQMQQSKQRISFSHELSALRVVIKDYIEYYEDDKFINPLKLRHADNINLYAASKDNDDYDLNLNPRRAPHEIASK